VYQPITGNVPTYINASWLSKSNKCYHRRRRHDHSQLRFDKVTGRQFFKPPSWCKSYKHLSPYHITSWYNSVRRL